MVATLDGAKSRPSDHPVIVGHLASQQTRSILPSQHSCHGAAYIWKKLVDCTGVPILQGDHMRLYSYMIGYRRVLGMYPSPRCQGRIGEAVSK
jgi:hypothetical protein